MVDDGRRRWEANVQDVGVARAGVHRCLVEVAAARETDLEQVARSAALFWGALRRVWDPSCGVALLVMVDGSRVRVAFDVTGDDPVRVGRYAQTIRGLARHTTDSLVWREVSTAGMPQPEGLVASFRPDQRREPVVSRVPVGLTSLVDTEGPWLLRLDLVAPLDCPDTAGTDDSDPHPEPAEALVSLALYGPPGPAGDTAAALLSADLAGPVSFVPEWATPAAPIELPAAGLHHLLAIPGRLAALLPASDPTTAEPLAELVTGLPAPHVLLLGTTGSGKSTSLVHLGTEAIADGEVVVAVDTHDGAVLANLAAQARRAGRPALHVAFGVSGGPVLDVTEAPAGVGVSLWTENLWSLIRHDVWHAMPDEFFGPVGEKAIRALLELAVRAKGFSLSDVSRLIDPAEADYRRAVLSRADAPEVTRSVLREVMPMISSGDNAALFVAGKFTPFSTAVFRDVTTGDGPRVPFERALDAGVSILIHAPASILGDIPSRTLVGAALRRLWLHLIRRHGGPRVTVLLDEWQRYAAGSAVTMLTESRKYRARLILANQVLTQLDQELRNAVLGNTGAVACYRVSPQDALALDGLFPTITIRRLQTLPRHTMAITWFEDDLLIPGPAPLDGHEEPADFAAQIDALRLESRADRQAVLTQLARAMHNAAGLLTGSSAERT